MKEDNPLIKTVPLHRPAPVEVQRILDSLDKLTRSVIAARLNSLTDGNSPNSVDFDRGACVGYADMLFFCGKVTGDEQKALAMHAKRLAEESGRYEPTLKEAGLMDLADAVVKAVQSPQASAHFQKRPSELKEAAIKFQLSAENYVEVAGGSMFTPSGRRID